MDVEVRGDGPTWFVLGQSHSSGWHASIDGEDLGEPVLVDGFANGWLVDPGHGTVSVHLSWRPQRIVWAGIGVSVLGLLLCLAVLVAGARRPTPPLVAAAGPLVRMRSLTSGPAPTWRRTVGVALAVGVVGGLVVHPLLGAVTVVATLVALRAPTGRAVGLAAPAFVLLAGGYTAAKQWRNDFPADFGWTDFFHPAHYLAWAGLVTLLMVLVVDRERRR